MTKPDNKHIITTGKHTNYVARGQWEYIERINCTNVVGIVAVTDDNHLILIHQYRPPAGCSVIEIPAGLVGDIPGQPHESIETAVRRELIEETGYDPKNITSLASGLPSAGITNESITLCLATDLTKVGPGGGDESENITVLKVPLDNVEQYLTEKAQQGYAIDIKIYSALYFLARHRCT